MSLARQSLALGLRIKNNSIKSKKLTTQNDVNEIINYLQMNVKQMTYDR